MTEYLSLIENRLQEYLPSKDCTEGVLMESMDYSLKAGGKRVRPCLALEFCKACGENLEKAVPFACGVEMIHTYSLIHDDLPDMDNDDMRRGKPSNHIVYGVSTAIIAGDALQSLAFETVLSEEAEKLCGSHACVKAARTLAKYCGAVGMCGGQMIDILYEEKKAGIEILREMDEKKTGALIKAACEMGCIAAGADEETIALAREYGDNIGLAFQIVDDMLDVLSTAQELGKPIGSDKENDKSTYVSLLGIEKCREIAKEATDKAVKALEGFKGDTKELKDFAYSLLNRTN